MAPPAGVRPDPMSRLRAAWARLAGAAIPWTMAWNGLRLASGVLLLPLLLRLLPTPDLGYYYVLLSTAALAPLLDLGLLTAIERNLAYAAAGATELQAMGLRAGTTASGQPNHRLLWQLLQTARRAGLLVIGASLPLLAGIGIVLTARRVDETSSPTLTWIALGLTVANCAAETALAWWNAFLRGMNFVVPSARILCLAYAGKLGLACLFLLAGGGLLSVPAAGILSATAGFLVSRRTCLRRLTIPQPAHVDPATIRHLLGILWPNSWRAGLQLLSSYLGANTNAILCLFTLGLAANAQYGLSIQVTLMIMSISSAWVLVKWPLAGRYRAQHDHAALRRLLRPRFGLQAATYVTLAALAWTLGPWLLTLIGSQKTLLPPGWFLLLLVASGLDLQASFWTTLLATENRIPSMRPVIVTNVVSLALTVILLQTTSLGVGALVLAPCLAAAAFNHWYWPRAGARSLHTTWWRFLFPKTP